jgi:hypothetical protein
VIVSEFLVLIAFGMVAGASGGTIMAIVLHKAAKRLEKQLDGYMNRNREAV